MARRYGEIKAMTNVPVTNTGHDAVEESVTLADLDASIDIDFAVPKREIAVGYACSIQVLRVYVGLRVAGTGWGHYVTRMPRASKLVGLQNTKSARLGLSNDTTDYAIVVPK